MSHFHESSPSLHQLSEYEGYAFILDVKLYVSLCLLCPVEYATQIILYYWSVLILHNSLDLYPQISSSFRQRYTVVSSLESLSPPQLLHTSLLKQHSSGKCRMNKWWRQGTFCLLSLLCAGLQHFAPVSWGLGQPWERHLWADHPGGIPFFVCMVLPQDTQRQHCGGIPAWFPGSNFPSSVDPRILPKDSDQKALRSGTFLHWEDRLSVHLHWYLWEALRIILLSAGSGSNTCADR